MKVGGNESATKYFQSHGGSAALASKDVKTKYTCNAAVKYKDELKRRAAADAQQLVMAISFVLVLHVRSLTGGSCLGTPEKLLLPTSPQAQPPMDRELPLMTMMISSLPGISLRLNGQATLPPVPVLLQS